MESNSAMEDLKDDKPLKKPSLAQVCGKIGCISLIPLATLFQLIGIVSTDLREACGDEAFLASTIPGALVCLQVTYEFIAGLVKGNSKMTKPEIMDIAVNISIGAFFLVGAPLLYFTNDSPSHGETVGMAMFDILIGIPVVMATLSLAVIICQDAKRALKDHHHHHQSMLESLKSVRHMVLTGPGSLQADPNLEKKSGSWFPCLGK